MQPFIVLQNKLIYSVYLDQPPGAVGANVIYAGSTPRFIAFFDNDGAEISRLTMH